MSANANFENKIAEHVSHGAKEDIAVSARPGVILSEPRNNRVTSSVVTQLDRWIARQMVEVVGNPPIVLILWDGVAVTPPVTNPIATIRYYNRSAMIKTILNPELYFGDLYSTGQATVEGDLVRFSEIIYSNLEDGASHNLAGTPTHCQLSR
jgi:hypothetical protein